MLLFHSQMAIKSLDAIKVSDINANARINIKTLLQDCSPLSLYDIFTTTPTFDPTIIKARFISEFKIPI